MVTKTPPMGWNSWNTFAENINEKLIMDSADAMVESGLKELGYEYIVIDDIWAKKERDENGKLVPDPEKFPNGMKYVADYVHSKGLKFGMYSSAGYLTCAGYPASYGNEWVDAETFAEWGVDFLKYDFCFHPQSVDSDVIYKRMGLALANCGRDILFSACSWGSDNTRNWIKECGAGMWRSTGDIFDGWQSVKSIGLSQIPLQDYNGQGCFNDMDMLVVGMHGKGNVGLTGCSFEEYKTHFSLWALLGSPLMIGCDIRDMDDETKTILMNKEIIKINQDPAARQPFILNMERDIKQNRLPGDGIYENYNLDNPAIAKFLDNGDIAIGFFNFTDDVVTRPGYSLYIDKLGLSEDTGKTLELYDLWSGEKVTLTSNMPILEDLAPHACRMFRAKVVDR